MRYGQKDTLFLGKLNQVLEDSILLPWVPLEGLILNDTTIHTVYMYARFTATKNFIVQLNPSREVPWLGIVLCYIGPDI